MRAEKNYSWNSTTYICENSKHLESAVDDWNIKCDQIIMWRMACQQIFMTKMSDAKWIILVITLLFIIAIICQHYAKLVQVKTKKHIAVLRIKT